MSPADEPVDDPVVSILQAALDDGKDHPGAVRVLHRLHPETAGGPLRRDWVEALQVANGRLVARFDADDEEIPGAMRPRFIRPLGPDGEDGYDELVRTEGGAVVRFVERDSVLVCCGRERPTLVPFDDVAEDWRTAERLDLPPAGRGSPGTVIRGP